MGGSSTTIYGGGGASPTQPKKKSLACWVGMGYKEGQEAPMCLHENVVEIGTEQFTFWAEGDLFTAVDFQKVRCPDCDSTFLLDDLHDLG